MRKLLLIVALALTTFVVTSSCMTRKPNYANVDHSVKSNGFKFDLFENEPFRIDRNNIVTIDAALPTHKMHPPLVLILHGNHSRKEAHRGQIISLAEHGIAALAFQFPNSGKWHDNGVLLAKAAAALANGFALNGRKVETDTVILVGHSFGGYAATVAAGIYGNISGLILLDPALYSQKGLTFFTNVTAPTVIIAADRRVFRSRKRSEFFEGIGGSALEFSVTGATHDDAQNPSMFALSSWGIDPYTSQARQKFITQMIVESAKAMSMKYQLPALADKLKELERTARISALKVRGPGRD